MTTENSLCQSPPSGNHMEDIRLSSFLLYDGTVYLARIVAEDACGWMLKDIRNVDFADEISLSRDAVQVYFTVLQGGKK